MQVDTTFDFRSDAGGKDPDTHSPTLRAYHQVLWSRPLPSGDQFGLDDTTPGAYLHHRSDLGEFFLSSDSIIPTFIRWKRLQPIIGQFSDAENEAFMAVAYTIGGMMIFPANQVDGKQTINVARGFTHAIADRMDLTLEAIRRHYLGLRSPLGATLDRYADFFGLFENFGGYVDFFLLNDLVEDDGATVKFLMPFDDFKPPSVPKEFEIYQEYRRRTIEFIDARNRRVNALNPLSR